MSHSQDIPEYDAIDIDRVWHTFECDLRGCSCTLSDNGQFMEVWNKAKLAGWVAIRDNHGMWLHYCPDHNPRRKNRGTPLV